MSSQPESTTQTNPSIYQIRLKGHLGREWTDWFGGMAVDLTEDGDTLLTGPVPDQAALHGLLKKVRDLGLPLLAVQCVGCEDVKKFDFSEKSNFLSGPQCAEPNDKGANRSDPNKENQP